MIHQIAAATVSLASLLCAAPAVAQTAPDISSILAGIDAAPRWSAVAPLATEAQRLAEDRHFSEATDGRSTITRLLLAKTLLPDRPGDRATTKMAEIEAAAAIGAARPADRILDAYVEGLFMGRGCYGIDPAARAFFGKPAAALSAAEAAVLAALPKSPEPLLKQPDKLAKRAAFVVTQMQDAGLAKGVTSADLPRIPASAGCGGL